MIESFITAFIIYFVVIDPVGNATIFWRSPARRTARKCAPRWKALVATMIMLFFALCGAWILAYLNISEPLSRLPVASSCFWWRWTCWQPNARPANVRQAQAQPRRTAMPPATVTGDSAGSHDRDGDHDNVAIYPLAIPLLAGPSAIMSVIVVTADFSSSLA